MLSQSLRLLISLYRMAISPLIHLFFGPQYGCRFQPSCSHYSIEAIQNHGAAKGTWLAVKRLFRCNPFGQAGYDPVPHAIAEFKVNRQTHQGR